MHPPHLNLTRCANFVAILGAAFTMLAQTALAQRFVFVTTRAPEADFIAYDRPWQSEIFVYRDGSEIRLTHTTHASEYDPVPSPSGGLVAYVALDHTQEEAQSNWGWFLGVMDALTGRPVAKWPLPNTVGMTRPAGGIQPTWESEGAVLVQVPSPVGEWEIHRFTVGEGASVLITTGFGIIRQPNGGVLATQRADGVYLVDVASGSERRLVAGTPLAWWGSYLFVARVDSLLLVSAADGETRQISTERGFYTELRVDPATGRYAYLRLAEDGTGSELVVADAAHDVVMRYAADGWLSGLDWLDEGSLVVAHEPLDGDTEILALDLMGRGFAVNSSGVDHSPRAF